jgi:hypothetical protein
MMQSTEWYVALDGRTVGPVTTELIMAGIERGRVPAHARVRPAGGVEWVDLAEVPFFGQKVTETGTAARTHLPSVNIDISLEEFDPPAPTAAAGFDWHEPIAPFGYLNGGVKLPDQHELLTSLAAVHDTILIQKDAMWNLALCLAFGSDELAEAAGHAFFRVYGQHSATDRLQWMPRVLLGRGFLPSGIPVEAGRRGLCVLESCCPAELLGKFARAIRGPAA